MSTPIPPFHNPNNLTPEQYGASEGWRLLRETEKGAPPDDTQVAQLNGPFQERGPLFKGHRCDFGSSYRTRTPDPFAPVDQWVKMSERKPTEADLPITVTNGNSVESFKKDGGYVPQGTQWTHWKSITLPARELTQAEKDQEAFEYSMKSRIGAHHIDTWMLALAYERARTAAK